MLGAVGSIIESKIANEAVGQYKNIFYHWEKSKDKLVSYFNDKDAELESHQHFLTSGLPNVVRSMSGWFQLFLLHSFMIRARFFTHLGLLANYVR